jgi:hypothetical protein
VETGKTIENFGLKCCVVLNFFDNPISMWAPRAHTLMGLVGPDFNWSGSVQKKN